MKVRSILIALILSGIWFTVHESSVFFSNPQPTVMPCAQFVREAPDVKWVHLTDCLIDPEEEIEAFNLGDKKVVMRLLPVRAPGDPIIPVHILVNVTRTRLPISKIATLRLEGLIRSGPNKDVKVRHAIKRAKLATTSNFVILEPDDKPTSTRALIGLAMTGMSLILLIIHERQLRRNRLASDSPENTTAS